MTSISENEKWSVTISKDGEGYRVYSDNNCGYSARSVRMETIDAARAMASRIGRKIGGVEVTRIERI